MKEQQSDLDLWPHDLKIIRKYLFTRDINYTKLSNFKLRGQKILSGQHLYNEQQFDLDLWLCDLKISREHLLSRGICCIMFGNFQRGDNENYIYWSSFVSWWGFLWSKFFGPFSKFHVFVVQEVVSVTVLLCHLSLSFFPFLEPIHPCFIVKHHYSLIFWSWCTRLELMFYKMKGNFHIEKKTKNWNRLNTCWKDCYPIIKINYSVGTGLTILMK